MNPANYREALIETHEDEAEGADILLVSMTIALMSTSTLHVLMILPLLLGQARSTLPRHYTASAG